MDLTKSYEVLGIPENSSMEEVEKRFDLLVRRLRGKQSIEGMDESESIVTAYKVIKESERQAAVDQYNQTRFGTDFKKKERMEKAEHFWSYYRWHVVGVIAAIVILVMVVNMVIEQRRLAALPPPALEVMLYGNYYDTDEASIEQALLARYTDWGRVKVIVNYLPSESSGAMDPAYVQKSFVVLATERPDVYILDSTTFATLMEQGGLTPLDELKSGISAEQLMTGTQPEDDQSHVYGVKINNSTLWNTVKIADIDKIAVIRQKPKNLQNAKRFIIDSAR